LFLAKLGYARAIVVGLVVMAIGCALFAPAAMSGQFAGFLIALFCVAAGITMLQVAANPFIATLGSAKTASSRLTLAQAFNSLGTFIGPFVGAIYFLKQGVGVPVGADEGCPASGANRRWSIVVWTIPGHCRFASSFRGVSSGWCATYGTPKIEAPQSSTPSVAASLGRPRLVFSVFLCILFVRGRGSIDRQRADEIT
jgi:MFS family permease